jgi:hypothetical protein
MSFEDTVKICTLASAFITPILVVGLTLWQNKRLTELKELAGLTLDIDNGDDCVCVDDRDYGDGKGKVPRCHVRFRLSVKGSPNGAKKCVVKLMRIQQFGADGSLLPVSYPNQQFLHWNGEWKRDQHTERDLHHGTEQYVDLLKIEEIGGNVSVRVKDVANSILPIEMGGTYRFEVKATAGNARAVGRMVEVVLGRAHDDVRIKRSRSIRY